MLSVLDIEPNNPFQSHLKRQLEPPRCKLDLATSLFASA
jgi:hypothetical protein